MNATIEEELACHLKERYSATTCSSNSLEEPLDHDFSFEADLIPTNPDLRYELFESCEEGGEVTQKMSQRAVSWIMTVCWSKNIEGECLWSTLLLFYCLKSQRNLKKDQLQLTLLSCLSLSIKLNHPTKLSLKQISCFSSKLISIPQMIAMQAFILQQVNYNLIIPHYVSQICNCAILVSQQIDKLEFLCELLMVKNEDVFLHKEKLELMIKTVSHLGNGENAQIGEEMKEEMRNVWALKESKIVVNKYSSKFDVDKTIKPFL